MRKCLLWRQAHCDQRLHGQCQPHGIVLREHVSGARANQRFQIRVIVRAYDYGQLRIQVARVVNQLLQSRAAIQQRHKGACLDHASRLQNIWASRVSEQDHMISVPCVLQPLYIPLYCEVRDITCFQGRCDQPTDRPATGYDDVSLERGGGPPKDIFGFL